MTNDQMKMNQKVAKGLGIGWHEISLKTPYMIDGVKVGKLYACSCGEIVHKIMIKEHTDNSNPDFAADPVALLREMRKVGKLNAFMVWLWDSEATVDDLGNVLMAGESFMKLLDYILDTTGQLRDKTIEWLEGRKEK